MSGVPNSKEKERVQQSLEKLNQSQREEVAKKFGEYKHWKADGTHYQQSESLVNLGSQTADRWQRLEKAIVETIEPPVPAPQPLPQPVPPPKRFKISGFFVAICIVIAIAIVIYAIWPSGFSSVQFSVTDGGVISQCGSNFPNAHVPFLIKVRSLVGKAIPQTGQIRLEVPKHLLIVRVILHHPGPVEVYADPDGCSKVLVFAKPGVDLEFFLDVCVISKEQENGDDLTDFAKKDYPGLRVWLEGNEIERVDDE
jgi:hypothetical protein